jgi:transposase
VKDWIVIHKIKALHDNGNGLSMRAIAKELGISRNTVRKYLNMNEASIDQQQQNPERSKSLDQYRDYLQLWLQRYPNLSAVKLMRRLRDQVPDLAVSDRTIRRYVQTLKQQTASAQARYYKPVLDDLPGVQCQVDPGELRQVKVGEALCTLYFVVFVLSFSRLMYVGLSWKPLDTRQFIQLHDEAFRYFGGVPEECVYDQTKLVVLDEQYRELNLNPLFARYATTIGLHIHACEGYDPESKGKVEAGVKYVKQDALYGEEFDSRDAVAIHVQEWLEQVANCRRHGSTGEAPRQRFEVQEQARLKPYLRPDSLYPDAPQTTRKADKTGLISWAGNKYSVPMAWQNNTVGVEVDDGHLIILDPVSAERLARHELCLEKGQKVINNHHYRDPQQRIPALEQQLIERLGDDSARSLCQRLRQREPKIYKDQLAGILEQIQRYPELPFDVLKSVASREDISARRFGEHLEAEQQAQERERQADTTEPSCPASGPLDLSRYAAVGHSSGQEVRHESA